jgi:hypothetical protein
VARLHLREEVLAIEAEARAGGPDPDKAVKLAYRKGRADALREAAERVRGLHREGRSDINYRAVLAILEPSDDREAGR